MLRFSLARPIARWTVTLALWGALTIFLCLAYHLMVGNLVTPEETGPEKRAVATNN